MSGNPEKVFAVEGWFDGEHDCEPPEPGKFWLTITENGEEFTIVTHRGSLTDHAVVEKELRAAWIAKVLNKQGEDRP